MADPQQFPALYSGTKCVSWVLEHVSEFDWFKCVGPPRNSTDPSTIRVNLNGNESQTVPIEYLESHREVTMCLLAEFDMKWLKNEESRRLELLATVQKHRKEDEVLQLHKILIDRLPGHIMQYAETCLASTDKYLPRVGVGSAVEACYLYALELFVTGRPGEFARHRLKLFELGRWPLCVNANRFAVF